MFNFSKKEINFVEVTGRVITILFNKNTGKQYFTLTFDNDTMLLLFFRDLEKKFDLILKEDLSNDIRTRYIYVVDNTNF